jgi:hypothetical protein
MQSTLRGELSGETQTSSYFCNPVPVAGNSRIRLWGSEWWYFISNSHADVGCDLGHVDDLRRRARSLLQKMRGTQQSEPLDP